MSTRLQVVMDDAELVALRADADRHGMTVSAWVRHAIRAARRAESDVAPSCKLDVVRQATEHAFPTGDIEVMLAETERGYLADNGG